MMLLMIWGWWWRRWCVIAINCPQPVSYSDVGKQYDNCSYIPPHVYICSSYICSLCFIMFISSSSDKCKASIWIECTEWFGAYQTSSCFLWWWQGWRWACSLSMMMMIAMMMSLLDNIQWIWITSGMPLLLQKKSKRDDFVLNYLRHFFNIFISHCMSL